MRFDIIYADPAWTYDDKALAGNRGAGCKYTLMTEQEMAALPIRDIAAPHSVCFMWATYPKLAEGLWLMKEWGFTYKTVAFTWVKPNGPFANLCAYLERGDWTDNGLIAHAHGVNKLWSIGMGRWTRSNAEIVLLGVRGKPSRCDAGVNQIICAPAGRHSAKPPETRERIVRLCGDAPRVELFAREKCKGWISLGGDIDGRDLRQSIPALARK